ncbi:WhiB family transcriptional regulator [Allokutzneria sp. NRRL B-24872]|uniref:WhiB family transcriptional regulator n=1 Tax=Allokutzneria sp. NRRL B-24872 TaxID=1137961 RepID=UPI00352D404A
MNPDDFFEVLAAELDRYADVPTDVLAEIMTRDGACMWLYANDSEPKWTGDDLTDRELAARICAGCPVRRECLELEFRTAGEFSLGVWGALCEDDRRAVYPIWLARRANSPERDGGRSS